ncbi:MAG TPA: hydrolase [Candidatus Sulfotelmatobacter sp.]|nr:hydrolase [Candidatus Sulfotelmatobacter sp.]
MPETPKLDSRSTTLVLIDLQKGIVSRPTAPHAAPDVVKRGVRLAQAFRERGALVVLVRVAFAADDSDRLKPMIDAAMPPGPWPADFADLLPEVGPKPGDLVITKHQWGAFYGTELDLQLRRRGIRNLVIGGISTNFGVESTARDAWERAYQLIFVEDAMAGPTAEAHAFATGTIFPRLGIVRSTEQVLGALGGSS